VLTSTYNSEKWVEKFVKDIIEKTEKSKIYELNEIIIVDDNSKDRTKKILRQLVAENSFISTIFLDRNVGQHEAIKMCFEITKNDNEYYVIIDSDLEEDINVILSESMTNHEVIFTKDTGKKRDSMYVLASEFVLYIAVLFGLNYRHRNIRTLRIFSKKVHRDIIMGKNKLLIVNYFSKYYDTSKFLKIDRKYKGTSNYSLTKLSKLAIKLIIGTYRKSHLLGFLLAFNVFLLYGNDMSTYLNIIVIEFVLIVSLFDGLYAYVLFKNKKKMSKKSSIKSAKNFTDSYYSKKIETYGNIPEGVDWSSAESMKKRFDVITDFINFSEALTCTDLGSGWGAFCAHLREKKIDIKYIGLDLSDKMISRARTVIGENENQQFKHSSSIDLYTDISVASGIFNVKGSFDKISWLNDYVVPVLENIIQKTEKAFAVNFLCINSNIKKEVLFYIDEKTIMDKILDIDPKIKLQIVKDYGLFEWTCIGTKV
jgi:hypothetical protein